jgi:hypothetical protein
MSFLSGLTGKAASGDAATSAIGLESGLVKSGYLVKRAKMSQSNWKKRYFVLNGHSLTYYKDIKQTGAAQGDLLLTDDTTVQSVQEANRGPCFDVNTPFAVLRLECVDARERELWMQAIKKVVSELKAATRGYLWRKGTGMFATLSRKFFIVHEDSITCHEDHMKTSKIDICVKLTEGNVTVDIRNDCVFAIVRDGADVMVLRAEDDAERETWVSAIKSAVNVEADGPKEDDTKYLLTSTLDIRSDKTRNANWDVRYFSLTTTTMKIYDDEKAFTEQRPIESFRLNPQCCVFETNLAANAFELVTAKKVLHMASADAKVSEEWIRTLRRLITQSQVTQGPLLDRCKDRWGNTSDGALSGPDFYNVSFETKRPLGLVLERSSEWAVVKLSNTNETGVSVGSVLYSVNDTPVTLCPYPDTIKMLTGWKPPLTLGFRHSPRKRGWLSKQSRGRNSSVKNWKDRFFVLEGGRLSYFEDDKGSDIKGDIQLMGSAVSLLNHSETGQFFCFRVVSGITSIVMQAKTVDDMMDWASVLYHASSMSNGGGYLLEIERERIAKYNAVKEREAAVKKAEQEAFDRKKAEEEAAAAAVAAAEAEAKAKAEKEAAMAAAAAAEAAASEEEKKAAAEAAKALEEAEAAAAAESARLAALSEAARKEAEEAAAKAAEDAAKLKAETEARLAAEAEAEKERLEQEAQRLKAMEEEAKAEALVVEAEEKEILAAEAAELSIAETPAAEGEEAAPPKPRGGRRPSVIMNDLGESDDDDDDDMVSPSESSPVAPTIQEEAPAPAPEPAPTPAPAPAAEPAPPVAKAAAATNKVEAVAENEAEAIDDMVLTDALLEECFTNLNGGSPNGSLNPMQMSILVRLITKRHDLMQEMKWFSKFDQDGVGGIDINEFKKGFRTIESTGLVDSDTGANIVSAIKSYVAHANFAL